jgi:hypothetical protein
MDSAVFTSFLDTYLTNTTSMGYSLEGKNRRSTIHSLFMYAESIFNIFHCGGFPPSFPLIRLTSIGFGLGLATSRGHRQATALIA